MCLRAFEREMTGWVQCTLRVLAAAVLWTDRQH